MTLELQQQEMAEGAARSMPFRWFDPSHGSPILPNLHSRPGLIDGLLAVEAPRISMEGDRMPKLRVEDITSLTNFHRNSTTHCKRLKKSGRPEVLTVNGKAVLVVQDAEAYQQLLEAVERISESLPKK
jgi:hypothetical protein